MGKPKIMQFILSVRTIKLLAYISLGLLFLSVWLTFYCYDDIELLAAYKASGYWIMMKKFMSFDGRVVTFVAFVNSAIMAVVLRSINLFLSFHILILLINSYLVVKIISFVNQRMNFSNTFLTIIFFTIFYWIGNYFQGSIADTLYRGLGTWYSMFNLTALAWIYFILKSKEVQGNNILLLKATAVSLLAGNTSPHIILGLCTLCVFELISAIEPYRRKLLMLSLTGLIIGFLPVAFAPGTRSRIIGGPGYSNSHNVQILFKGYYTVINNHIHYYLMFFILFFLLFLVSVINSRTKKASSSSVGSGLKKVLYFIDKYKFFIAMLISVVPFSIIPNATAGRTSIFGSYLLTFQFFSLVKVELNLVQNTAKTIFISVSALFILLISKNIHDAYPLYKELKMREKVLKESSNKDVVLKPITSRIPAIYKFIEITNDSTNTKNRSYAIFYGPKSVRVEDVGSNK